MDFWGRVNARTRVNEGIRYEKRGRLGIELFFRCFSMITRVVCGDARQESRGEVVQLARVAVLIYSELWDFAVGREG